MGDRLENLMFVERQECRQPIETQSPGYPVEDF